MDGTVRICSRRWSLVLSLEQYGHKSDWPYQPSTLLSSVSPDKLEKDPQLRQERFLPRKLQIGIRQLS
jgi:hypothetical protein